jgi:hypothetical protein
MISFLDIILGPNIYLKRCFGDRTLSPSSGKKPILLGPIDIASPHLRFPVTETSFKIKILILIYHRHEFLDYIYYTEAWSLDSSLYPTCKRHGRLPA